MDPRNVADIYPLSPIQKTVLLHELHNQDSRNHCGRLTCEIHCDLDMQVFKQAWQQIINRHQILRTSFVLKRLDKPVQVVHKHLGFSLEKHDWRGMGRIEQQQRWGTLLESDAARGFDLSQAPLIRILLCRMAEKEYKFIWSYHQLILDDWSLHLILNQVAAIYDGSYNAGQSLQIEWGRPYWDYIEWLNKKDISQAETFWRQMLNGFTEPTLVVANLSASKSQSRMGCETQQTYLTTEMTSALHSLVEARGLNLDAMVEGAWALLLSHYSGQEDVIFGATVSGRPPDLDGSESLVGPLLTTLPMRVRVQPGAEAISWLVELQSKLNSLRQNQYIHPLQVLDWSKLSEGLPLFESRHILDNYPINGSFQLHSQNLCVRDIEVHGQMNHPITLKTVPGQQLMLEIIYDRERIGPSSVSRMLESLVEVLESIVAQPDRNLATITFLPEAARRQLLIEWNDTRTEYPRDLSIHQLFDNQAHLTPHVVAATFANQHISYQELNSRANQLAHYLTAFGVGPEIAIAICIEPSIELLIALLAILKAGGVYVPLDPSYPLERLAFILEETNAPLIIAQEKLSELLPTSRAQVVYIDADWQAIADQSADMPAFVTESDNLAYVMYTSGSTGRPKGVCVTHRGVVRLVKQTNYASLTGDETFLQFAPVTFDASTFEIWGCLLNGGRLVIMPAGRPSLEELGEAIKDEGVSTLWLTAGLFHLMVDERIEDLKGVRQLLAGGDVLSAKHVKKALRECEGVEVINGYGPTENTTFTCCYRMREEEEVGESVLIGEAISNTRVYIMGRQMSGVPIGVRGEICIGGDGLARCYEGRAEQTAERFVPDPYSREGGGRLYRTGDQGRHNEEGKIEFLGRIDNQVKLRGHRIELEEIEAIMRQHPAIKEAVAVTRDDKQIEKRLIGYMILEEGREVTTGEIRSYLKNKLPEFMVPSGFVILDKLPLTPNGKIDRRALPELEPGRPDLEEKFVEARTPVEEILASVFAEVLSLEQVGINDNFFDLGGDSIRSIQARAKAQQLGLDFSIQQLFQYQTIAELAPVVKVLDYGSLTTTATEPFSLISEQDRSKLPEDVEDAYPLTMLQAGMLFHSEFSPAEAIYHDIFSFHMRAPYDLDTMRERIQQLMASHAVLRTSFHFTEFSQPLQFVHRKVEIPFQAEDITHLSPDEQEGVLNDWMEAEKAKGFDWVRPPIVRFQVHRRDEESFQVSVSFHHALLDGWSLASMLTELFRLYVIQTTQRIRPAEPAPKIAFRDYVALEQKSLGSEECRQYWVEKLNGSATTTLPRWPSSYRTEDSLRTRKREIALSLESSEGLKHLARLAGAPIKAVLLAAHLRILSLLTGQSDIVTGLVSNARPEGIDAERVLGLFLNTVPFRLSLNGGRWVDLVQETFKAEREMLPFRHYPMARIQRDRDGRPLFETVFNFTHFHVYQTLQEFTEVEVLSERGFANSNYDFWADFSLDLSNTQVRLGLTAYGDQLCDQQLDAISGYYEKALTLMASNPLARYELESLMSDEEQDQIVVEWNKTEADYSRQASIQSLFEEQAERSPEAIAVVCEDEQISYRELNERANQLGHYLRGKGVSAEDRVAVCMRRGKEMMVALLGILKAGAAYVPLDPDYPDDRLRYMLEDAQVRALLTEQRLLQMLPEGRTGTICMDKDWAAIASHSTQNLTPVTTEDNLAYVIYTSGSTGQPKGVMIQHRSLVNYAELMGDYYNIRPDDRILQFASISFDASAEEIYPCLTRGATLVLRTSSMLNSLSEFARQCRDYALTVLDLPTAYWHEMALELAKQNAALPPSVRLLIIGGERALPERLAKWQEYIDQQLRLVNTYGPTETTIVATTWDMRERPKAIAALQEVPIGRPIRNVKNYVLNQHLQPVPIGVPGQLYVAGEGLARGSLNRPHLTAEKFIPNPFSAEDGARMYATGDLVRYLPDGNIEFLGRVDNQVKIRGYRIETGEIESVLRRHSAVRDAVVIAREDRPGDKRLLSYVVPTVQCVNPDEQVSPVEFDSEQVSQWETVFSDLYGEIPSDVEPAFHIKGWISSYTDLPIPGEEVAEWVDQTVQRILSLRPGRVLEIGAGSGLMLFRIAPHCEYYCATDVSRNPLRYIQQQLPTLKEHSRKVSLRHQAADDLGALEDNSFDMVLLVSVAQYFPSVDYLFRVLEGAIRVASPSAMIFVADVRSLPLLEAFHTSVQLYRAPANLSKAELQQRIQRQIVREKQLVIDPDFFPALQQHFEKISRVEVFLQRGRYENELTKFRYDVVIRVGPDSGEVVDVSWLDWNESLTIQSIRELLEKQQPEILGIAGVPNSRLLADIKAVEFLKMTGGPQTVAELREALRDVSKRGVDPEDFWALENDLPYYADISCSGWDTEGKFDVVLKRRTRDWTGVRIQASRPAASRSNHTRRRDNSTNSPAQSMLLTKLPQALREYLMDQLPEYMVPQTFMILEELPLTPNGKVDGRALLALEPVNLQIGEAFVPPRDSYELLLTHIWEEVLGIGPLGVKDSFFDLGGHSLLAVRVMAQIGRAFGKTIPLAALFQNSTIERLASLIRLQPESDDWLPLVPIQPKGSRPPFFCVHPVGGNVFCYMELARHLDADQPFYGLQSQGVDGGSPPRADVETMATQYVKALRAIQPSGPYLLGGWSMGGVVAFEMAQQLQAQGEEVALLALFDTAAPIESQEVPQENIPSLLVAFAYDLGINLDNFEISQDDLLQLGLDEQLAVVFQQASKMDLLPPDVGLAQFRKLFQVLKANNQAMLAYRPRIYPGRITFFKASESIQQLAREGLLIESHNHSPLFSAGQQLTIPIDDASLGWSKLAMGGQVTYIVPGDHYTIVRGEHAHFLAELLNRCLQDVAEEQLS